MQIQQRIEPAVDMPSDSQRSEAATIIPWPTVITRSVRVAGRRVRVSLETNVWEGMADIARREGETLDGLCARIDERRGAMALTSAIRVFVLHYFRAAELP